MVLKLWLLKDVPNGLGDSFRCHNLNSVDPISTIYDFLNAKKETVPSKFRFKR